MSSNEAGPNAEAVSPLSNEDTPVRVLQAAYRRDLHESTGHLKSIQAGSLFSSVGTAIDATFTSNTGVCVDLCVSSISFLDETKVALSTSEGFWIFDILG